LTSTPLSASSLQIHVRLLLPYIGDMEVHQVHGAMLEPFVASRVTAGASATTINRSLEPDKARPAAGATTPRASELLAKGQPVGESYD